MTPPTGIVNYKVMASNFVNICEDVGRRRLAQSKSALTELDRLYLEDAIRDLRPRFASLEAAIAAMGGSEREIAIFCSLTWLMNYCFDIGTLAQTSPQELEQIRKGREGGLKGSIKRSVKTKEWKNIAEKMIVEIRRENPSMSQANVAIEVNFVWKEKDLKAPGHSRLKAFVSELEKKGDVPKAIRNRVSEGSSGS